MLGLHRPHSVPSNPGTGQTGLCRKWTLSVRLTRARKGAENRELESRPGLLKLTWGAAEGLHEKHQLDWFVCCQLT